MNTISSVHCSHALTVGFLAPKDELLASRPKRPSATKTRRRIGRGAFLFMKVNQARQQVVHGIPRFRRLTRRPASATMHVTSVDLEKVQRIKPHPASALLSFARANHTFFVSAPTRHQQHRILTWLPLPCHVSRHNTEQCYHICVIYTYTITPIRLHTLSRPYSK